MSEQIRELYNFRCYNRTNLWTLQLSVLYRNKLQDCTIFGVISEQITILYNTRFYIRRSHSAAQGSMLYQNKL